MPGQQLSSDGDVWFVDKVRLVLLIRFHQPLDILDLIYQPADGQLTRHIDKKGMGGEAAEVFQFHLEWAIAHGDGAKTLDDPFFHKRQLGESHQCYMRLAAEGRGGLVGVVEFFFYLLDLAAQLFMRV